MLDPSNRSSPEIAAEVPTPRNLQERLELANKLYREYRVQCFWQSPDDLIINEDRIPFVMKGLRANGGRRGFVLAGKLSANPSEPLMSTTLNHANEPVTPDPDSPEFPGLVRHFGRVGGAWPRIT